MGKKFDENDFFRRNAIFLRDDEKQDTLSLYTRHTIIINKTRYHYKQDTLSL